METTLKQPILESLIVFGLCCQDQYGCGWDHWHIYVDDEHIDSKEAHNV